MRQTATLVQQLPAIRAPQFHQSFLMVRASGEHIFLSSFEAERSWSGMLPLVQDFNDAMLTVFMSSMTNGVNAVNEVVEKVNIAYDKSVRRRGVFT